MSNIERNGKKISLRDFSDRDLVGFLRLRLSNYRKLSVDMAKMYPYNKMVDQLQDFAHYN